MMDRVDFREKVMHPDFFDNSVIIQPALADQYQAASVMTLGRFLQDLNGEDMDKQHLIQHFPTKTVSRGIWPLKIQSTKFIFSPEDLIMCNRNNYSSFIAVQEGLEEFAVSDDLANNPLQVYLYNVHAHYNYAEPVRNRKMINELIKTANNPLSQAFPKEQIDEVANWLLEAVGGIDQINKFLHMTQQRRGVQVIYGGDTFRAYRNLSLQRDNRAESSEEILYPRIPYQMALAVLPLGAYERQYFKERGVEDL
jgi:hypothetical protein